MHKDDFNASSKFAFASMIYKYYHFVFETTYITVCWLLIFTCQGELWWSSVLHIPLYVDCWPLPGRRILTIFIDISSPGRVISHLNVSSVHSSDGGLYRCQAQNSVSFLIYWISLVIIYIYILGGDGRSLRKVECVWSAIIAWSAECHRCLEVF